MAESTFIFQEPASVVQPGDFVARVERGVWGKDALLTALERALELPDYFGRNWDALSECLRDLHWRPERRVVLVHSDVPTLARGEWRTYLDVLTQAVRDWGSADEHELVVVFPPDAKEQVEKGSAPAV